MSHGGRRRTAVIVVKSAGGEEIAELPPDQRGLRALRALAGREGRRAGDRVAIKLEPSRGFYAAVFGAMKAGAIAVPLFTLFGPDGVRLRVEDCKPKLLIEDGRCS